jgi:uncharacterized iron-regulated membrane protein
MKRIQNLQLVSLLTLVLLAGCVKNNETNDHTDLIGSWQWVRTDGGIGNHIHQTPATTGNQVELRLSAGNHYAIYTNGTTTQQGTYYIETRQCIHDQTAKRVLVFTNGSGDMMVEYKSNDTLSLSDDHYDGIGSLYIKK